MTTLLRLVRAQVRYVKTFKIDNRLNCNFLAIIDVEQETQLDPNIMEEIYKVL